jgi:hypothetical protein
LLQNDPLRGPVALRLLDGLIALPVDADGLGTATLVDGNALLSRAKLSSNTQQRLSSLIGTPQGRAAVVQIGTASELRPTGLDQTQNLGPFRARSYAAAVVGGPQGADEAAASRERLLAGLPDFLQRCVSGKSEAEAFFLAILGQLHKKGVLDANHDNGHFLLEAVRAVQADEGAAVVARHVALTNGVDVLHVAAGLPSAVITISGLPEDVAGAVSPSFVDSSTARERNRRYRGVFALGALAATLKAQTTMPARATLQVLPDVAAVLVGRDLSVRVL